ncbi:MAG: NAD-binding protein [Candidatus Aminicenantes bacterium]|nr:NAD-binding protein [Candidatus Aminicenantes bacterium]
MEKSKSDSNLTKSHRPIKHFWNNYQWMEWMVIIILAAVVYFLGLWGFANLFSEMKETVSPLDICYRGIQLFLLGLDPAFKCLNWQLEAARWLAPAIAGYTAFKALTVIFREQWQLIRLPFLSKHIIICGLGSKGLLMSQRFIEEGHKVVVIENDENNESLAQCRKNGAIVLIGNAMDEETLLKARLEKAEHMFCVCGDDGINADVASYACDLIRGGGNKTLVCKALISDPRFCHLLKEREFELVKEGEEGSRLEFFNLFDYAARAMIDDSLLFEKSMGANRPVPHVLIVGAGKLGESLIVHAARKWMGLEKKPARKFKISIVDKAARENGKLFEHRYPQLTKLSDLTPLQMDIHSKDFEEGSFLFNFRLFSKRKCDISIIYVCLDDDSFALSTALVLHQLLREYDIPIVVQMDREGGLASLVEGKFHGLARVDAFGFLDSVLKPGLLFHGTNEILARAIHADYLKKELAKGEVLDNKPALVLWDRLPGYLKESNRQQATQMSKKLDAIDCHIVPMTGLAPKPVKFTDAEIEKMAEMEHERWMKEKLDDGWKYGVKKDPVEKTHPCIVGWDEKNENGKNKLSEAEKDKDRAAVRGMPNFLAEAGFEIHRRGKK